MPSLKRNVKDAEERTGFETYDGEEPPKGIYRAKIKSVKIREASTGTMGFQVLAILEAREGSAHSKFDGFPAWTNIWLTDKEANQAREKAFYRSVGASTDGETNVVFEDLEDGGRVKKIGGKDPVGAIVKVDLKREDGYGMQGDTIYPVDPAKEKASKKSAPEPDEDDEDDLIEDDDTAEEDEGYTAEELRALSLPELRKLAKESGLEVKGLKKDDIVDSLIDFFAEGDDEDEDEDDDEDEVEGDEVITAADLLEYTLPNLKKFAREEGGYSNDDLKGLKKEEIVELLVDDEVVANEPPF